MAATRHVYAVPGRLYSLPGRKGDFVGYERLAPGQKGGDVHVPEGSGYVLRVSGEDVPDTIDVRRALRDGDITEAVPVTAVVVPEPAPEVPAPAVADAPSDAGDTAGDEADQ